MRPELGGSSPASWASKVVLPAPLGPMTARSSPSATLRFNESLTVSFELVNTGKVGGPEVAQLYLRALVASVTRPSRELKRFARVELGPGERRRVEFQLGTEDLAFVGQDMKRRVEPGRFHLFVGGSSRAALQSEFALR